MQLIFIYLLVIFGLLTVLNTVATYIVWNTYFEVKKRRLYQTVFIWLVPLVGPLMAIYINREESFATKQKRQEGNNPSMTDQQGVNMGYFSGGGR